MWCNPSGAIKMAQSTHSIICIICVMQSLWRRVCGAICAVQSKWRNRYNAIYQVWGGTRSDARRKKSNAKKKPPCRRRRAPDGGDVVFSHLSGAREQGAQSPSPPQDCATSCALACTRAAMKMLALACPPGNGPRRVGEKLAASGAGMGNPHEKRKKHARGEIWVEKIFTATHTKTQSRRPLATGKISRLFHHVSTAFSPHPSPDWPADDFDGPKPSSRSSEMRAPTPEL